MCGFRVKHGMTKNSYIIKIPFHPAFFNQHSVRHPEFISGSLKRKKPLFLAAEY